LVTSSDSGLNWDLRCKVREALVDVMQRDWPGYLPVSRVEVGERFGDGSDSGSGGGLLG